MPKLLADFLQEQQEPFALEVYLVERGHSLNNIARCTLQNSAQYVAPNCSYFLRTLFNQLVVSGGRKSFLLGGSKSRRRNAAQSNTTLFKSCGNCFLEGELSMKPTNSKLRRDEDGKQLSPVSVLGQTVDEDSPFHYKQRNLKARREPSNLISQCRQKAIGYDQYIINKKALQQRKQLRIECTKEVIEKYREKEKNIEILESGEICKYVLEKIWIWSHECINESNIFNLLHSELLASEDEWNAVFEMQKFQISIEIENALMENVINEMITCMTEW